MRSNEFPTWRAGLARLAVRGLVIVIAVFAIYSGLEWVSEKASEAGNERLMIGMLTLVLIGYALLIAVPFMPGIEVGISLLILQGANVAPFVYIATVTGLILAFLVGRLIPYSWIHALLRDLRWQSACELIERLEPMDSVQRMAHLTARMPEPARPLIRAGRYVLLAWLFNVPGNAVIGGGGGIAFLAGFSRLFHPTWTALAIALGVLPVPLIVWLSGVEILL